MLPSGLPEIVADAEALSRFLTQSSQYNAVMAKPSAFLPNPHYRNTSVFRFGADSERVRETWNATAAEGRTLKGVAVFTAVGARAAQLEVTAEEPPPAHANIDGWPWHPSDPELQKAQQKERAADLASRTKVFLF